jgi:hypothetical protein
MIFFGKIREDTDKWADQSPEWKKSKDLTLYNVLEKDGSIFVEIP